MSNKLDFYYAPAKAQELIDRSSSSKKKIPKQTFCGNVFTEFVKQDTLPTCGVADSYFLGTGIQSDIGQLGVW